eukprot:10639066-Lingulodinium_polyedra.AAC.1
MSASWQIIDIAIVIAVGVALVLSLIDDWNESYATGETGVKLNKTKNRCHHENNAKTENTDNTKIHT